jgi:hypothetical protein
MSNVNDFLPFCATDTGTNLISQSNWVASAARPIGNQPGVASSAFNNKALRQATYIMANLAQYVSNQANVSTLDNANPAQILAQITAALMPISPLLNSYLSGTGTWNATFYFFTGAANATAGATYTNNSVTFTVTTTISGGMLLVATGNGLPSAGGGNLTKASGTGDTTIPFYAFRAPAYLKLRMVGGGGGGAGSGTAGGANGGDGTNTTWGSLLTAGLGGGGFVGGSGGGSGGSPTVNSPALAIISLAGGVGGFPGMSGGGTLLSGFDIPGGAGAYTPFGGAGAGSTADGNDAVSNTGSGGQGGGNNAFSSNLSLGNGGGAGAYIEAILLLSAYTYSYSIGTGGGGGAAGTSGQNGGNGGSGLILLEQHYQ